MMTATARATATVAAVLGAVLAVVAPSHAHELGKTQAVAALDLIASTYQIDVVVDPDALLTLLEVRDGRDVSSPAGRDARDRQIAALGPVFIGAVRVNFDARGAMPRFEYRPASALGDLAQAPSTVRLSGQIPSGARDFTFAYELATGTFALVARVAGGPAQTFWLERGEESAAVSIQAPPPAPSGMDVARRYFALGFTHILPKGLDHILFVVGLFLLSARWRSVVLQVSAFTIAHSITLGLTIYGIVSLPARVVEPMIALSIAYVAFENLVTTELKSWRIALVFSFGLLHGMGFAGVLRDLGLPRADFLTALLTFNLGVEAGQLTVVALAFLAVAYWRRNAESYRRFVVQPASAAIAVTGLYWTIVRLL